MNKTRRTIALILLIAAVVGIIFWSNLAGTGSNDQRRQLGPYEKIGFQSVQPALGQGKALIVAFTYWGDCCDSTKEFYSAYDRAVSQLHQGYRDQTILVWLDLATEDSAEQQGLRGIAQKYGVTTVPSLLVVGFDGERVGVIPGMFDVAQASQLLRKALGTNG